MPLHKYKKDKQFCLSFFFMSYWAKSKYQERIVRVLSAIHIPAFRSNIFVKVLNFDKDDFRYNQG